MYRHSTTTKKGRRHPRVVGDGLAGHLQVGLEVLKVKRVKNLSLGGCLLTLAGRVEKGRNVFVELTHPALGRIRLVGRVLAPHSSGARVEFHPLRLHQARALHRMIVAVSAGSHAYSSIGRAVSSLAEAWEEGSAEPVADDFEGDASCFEDILPTVRRELWV